MFSAGTAERADAVSAAPRVTKQASIADALCGEIRCGRYKIGDHLPSEPELSLRFGVSRHTVRAALRRLRDLGLVSSRQGVGTAVRQTRLVSRYSQTFDSAEDLLQYAATTTLRVIDRLDIVVDADQATYLGCGRGEQWQRIRTIRSEPTGGCVVAYSEIHIPQAFAAVVDGLSRSRQPIFALIERRFRETITEIRQDINGISAMEADESRFLGLPDNSPGMEITRRYIGTRGRVLEVARSVHPSGLFRYSTRVQLRHGS